jgi:RND family efflux transporter MFP subunit
VVVRLDSRDLEARRREAREQVAAAQAGLALARTERERFQRLFEQKVASRQQLDRAIADYQVAAAELESAQQRAAAAEVSLSYAEIRSPVSGRVVDRLAEPGDTASPGAALLRIYDPGSMRLEAPVRETLATRLAPGQELDVEIEALGLTTRGAIDEIVPAAEPGARTFLVKVRLPGDARLYAGMFGRLAVPAGRGPRLVVDASAVDRIGQLEYVRVVGEDGRVGRRMVTTGPPTPGGGIEVLSGLAAGERVLVP